MYRKFEYILHMRKYEPVIVLFQSFVKNPQDIFVIVDRANYVLALSCLH